MRGRHSGRLTADGGGSYARPALAIEDRGTEDRPGRPPLEGSTVASISTKPPAAGTDREGDRAQLALAVADAGWYTTENLFGEVPRSRASTLLLRCSDVRVAWGQGQRPWRWNQAGGRRTRPGPVAARPGPPLGLDEVVSPDRHAADRPRDPLDGVPITAGGGPLALVMTYPYYLHLADLAWPDRLVYFNIDDYRLYWPKAADEVAPARAAGRPRGRPDRLHLAGPRRGTARAVPEAASGSTTSPTAPPRRRSARPPAGPPRRGPGRHRPPASRPLIGYVGTLEDRVDWSLAGPRGPSTNPGSLDRPGRPGRPRTAMPPGRPTGKLAWARPNVHAIGWRAQESSTPTIARSTSA